jgi:hypothetical protein
LIGACILPRLQDTREPGCWYGSAGTHHDLRDGGEGAPSRTMRTHSLQEARYGMLPTAVQKLVGTGTLTEKSVRR